MAMSDNLFCVVIMVLLAIVGLCLMLWSLSKQTG